MFVYTAASSNYYIFVKGSYSLSLGLQSAEGSGGAPGGRGGGGMDPGNNGGGGGGTAPPRAGGRGGASGALVSTVGVDTCD